MGMSLSFAIYTSFMLVTVMGMHLYSMYIMPHARDMGDDLSRVETKLERFMKIKRIRLIVGCMMIIVMMGWIVAELPAGGDRESLLISSCIGLVIGLVIAAIILTRIRNNTHGIREGIASLKEEEEKKRG